MRAPAHFWTPRSTSAYLRTIGSTPGPLPANRKWIRLNFGTPEMSLVHCRCTRRFATAQEEPPLYGTCHHYTGHATTTPDMPPLHGTSAPAHFQTTGSNPSPLRDCQECSRTIPSPFHQGRFHRSGSGFGNGPGVLPVVKKWAGGTHGGPELSRGCSRRSGSGPGALPVVQNWAEVTPGCQEVGRGTPSRPEMGQGRCLRSEFVPGANPADQQWSVSAPGGLEVGRVWSRGIPGRLERGQGHFLSAGRGLVVLLAFEVGWGHSR